MSWKPWEPYDQETTDPSVVICSGDRGFVLSVTFNGYSVEVDPAARQCAMQHIQHGSSVTSTWTGSCPNLNQPVLVGSPQASLRITWSPTYISPGWVSALGSIGGTSLEANTTQSHGMLSWQDPANDPPPSLVIDPDVGVLTIAEYAPFTSLTAELRLGKLDCIADLPFEFYANRVTAEEFTQWTDINVGTTWYSVSITQPGDSTIYPETYPLPNIETEPYYFRTVASSTAPGFFLEDDPGTSSAWDSRDFFMGVLTGYLGFNVVRHGMRRLWSESVTSSMPTPPLQQRQRADGLGGSAIHSGKGINTRQSSVFQRGVL